MAQEGSKQTLSTVDRAMSLLTLFLKHDTLSLVDIEREMGISKTAAFRLTVTMSERGFLVKDLDSKRFSPGPVLFQLVSKYQVNDIVTFSYPFIQELAQITNESVYLSIRSGYKYIYVNGIESKSALKVTSPIGDEVDFYFSAAGKLHMSFMSLLEIDNYLKRVTLEQFTPKTITSKDKLKKELTEIRKCGYSTSIGERETGSAGVAAPIWGHEEEPAAILSITFPASRMKKQQLVELVTKYAKEVSTQFDSR